MTGTAGRMVVLGRFGAPWGVQGWIKVQSYTDPPDGLLGYGTWCVARHGGGWDEVRVREGRPHGNDLLVVALEGIHSPEEARAYTSREIAAARTDLPALAPGEFYWDDLVGCRVVTVGGVELGTVTHFHEFPANPVMAVKGAGRNEHWVPLVPRHLKEVDLAARRVVVDWDPEF
jgi:16S rRNA processing protein RimM